MTVSTAVIGWRTEAGRELDYRRQRPRQPYFSMQSTPTMIDFEAKPDPLALVDTPVAILEVESDSGVLVIEAGRTEQQYWRDLWSYRELFYFLTWRDLLVRYKQTLVGVSWSLIRPLLTMAVLTVVFGKLGKMPSGGVPYPMLVFCAMLPWQFFSTALTESGNSLVLNASLISKVYFPRLVIAGSSILPAFVDFLITGVFLAVLMIWYRFIPPFQIV